MKRLFDIVCSIILIVVLSPLLVFLSLKIRKNLGSPILFRQQRPGKNGEIFEIIKFRTMLNAPSGEDLLLSDAERLTPFGKSLRSTSLDELPELWNVLKGDMSFVGPRPLLTQYLPLYSPEQARRHDVRPGLTGWAQINGRNAISWDQKFALDIWYVDNQSFFLDMKILLITVKKVLLREGISAKGEATIRPFNGSSKDE